MIDPEKVARAMRAFEDGLRRFGDAWTEAHEAAKAGAAAAEGEKP